MANMKRCDQGHYYDADKHSNCPSCGVQGLDIVPTRARPSPLDDTGPTGGGFYPQPGIGSTKRPDQPPQRPGPGPGVTVSLPKKKIGIEPVLGWLVCVEGPERGRDYRILKERSSIGRDDNMDIHIGADLTISRHRHAIISFNPRDNTFKVVPGEGGGQTYLNGNVVDLPMPLNSYDCIELGETKLLFIPLCGEQFKWEPEVAESH